MGALQGKRVLVVEDDPSIAIFVAHVLTQSALDVTHVSSAELALESVCAGSWDCLLTDIRLPGMSGLTLTRQIRAAGHDLPVAVMTAHHGPGMDAEALAAGADAFLPKPFSPSVLRAQLECLLQDRPDVGGALPGCG